MTTDDHIHNPIEWSWARLKGAKHAVDVGAHAVEGDARIRDGRALAVRRITTDDLRTALRMGVEDFGACRTDVIFLCLIYPVIGLVLAQVTFGAGLLPLVFPLVSGFALLGPIAAMGLYEMSRRRELGEEVSWGSAFGVLGKPALGAIVAMSVLLLAIFGAWLAVAWGIYAATLGPALPASMGAFLSAVFGTGAGWAMIVLGCGAGFLFAALVLIISVVSFPLLIDRDVGVRAAVSASVRAVAANPGAMALWGMIVAGGLVLGSIPALLGLAIVLPVLGHATWHLYRRVIAG